MPGSLYLVDTSVWVLALRKKPSPKVQERVDALLASGLVAVTPPVRMELLAGTKTETEYLKLGERLDALVELPAGRDVWARAAQLGFGLRRKGITVPHIDLVIAAVAAQSEATLVHADSDFDLLAKHTGLGVESFVDAARKG